MTNPRSGSFSPRVFVSAVVLAAAATSANAVFLTYSAVLDGPSESPPNASPGTGFTTVTIDTFTHMMHVQAAFTGLQGNTTASHIHAATTVPNTGTAIVATQTPSFMGFPLGVTSGAFDNTFDMSLSSSYNAAFVTAHGGTVPTAEAFFFASLASESAYLNIHTSQVPGGEIRGFLHLVPAPGAAALFGVSALFASRRKRA